MADGADLQFDRAEFERPPAEPQCAECHRQLTTHYFEVNGHVVCEACRYTIESRQNTGSPGGRFVRAAGAGLGAAVLGSLLYYAISALTGYEFGLIAIVVGFGVGTAVRWGSNGRGGWAYQSLAMLLTYLAIVGTYIPPIVQAIREGAAADAAVVQTQDQPAGSATAEPAAVTPPATPGTPEPEPEPSAAGAGLALVFLLALAMAAPFLAGFENIIGLVIIGIGLYEAWKLNKRSDLAITGPHTLARPPVAAAGA